MEAAEVSACIPNYGVCTFEQITVCADCPGLKVARAGAAQLQADVRPSADLHGPPPSACLTPYGSSQ
eukprot:14813950-Alexandrium_andersonii.AAC.1